MVAKTSEERKQYLWDVAERVFWTGAEAGIAVGIDQLSTGEISWRAILYAILLALAKTIAARHIGTEGTARIAPPQSPKQ